MTKVPPPASYGPLPDLNRLAATYLGAGMRVQISVANLVVVWRITVIFAAAILPPFPGTMRRK